MRGQFLHTAFFFIMTISTFQIYTMEKSIIYIETLSKSSSYQYRYNELNLDIYKQLNIPYDFLHKVFALCSHKTRCAAAFTCKQFYCVASINELHKLVAHDFIIGDEQEKEFFFKTIIKKNHPNLITPLLTHAQKKAQSLPHDAVCIELNNPVERKKKEEQYIQSSYLNPLLQEAIKQDNTELIDRLRTENIDINLYHTALQDKKCSKIITMVKIGVVITVASGFLSLFTWLATGFYNTRCGYLICPNGARIPMPCNGSLPHC